MRDKNLWVLLLRPMPSLSHDPSSIRILNVVDVDFEVSFYFNLNHVSAG